MENRPKTMRLWGVIGSLLTIGLIGWWLSSSSEPGTDQGLAQPTDAPSMVTEPTSLPDGRALEGDELAHQPSTSPDSSPEVEISPDGGPEESAIPYVAERDSRAREDERREAEARRRAEEAPPLYDATAGELAALEREGLLTAEPPPEVLEEMLRESEIMPPQDVLDELRRQSELEPSREQLDRLYREADVQPSRERLEELKRQSEID